MVSYDIVAKVVQVLAVVSKQKAEVWLAKEAAPTKEGGASKGEGCPLTVLEAGYR